MWPPPIPRHDSRSTADGVVVVEPSEALNTILASKDLLSVIFSHFILPEHLVACQRVCRRWHEVASPILAQRFELMHIHLDQDLYDAFQRGRHYHLDDVIAGPGWNSFAQLCQISREQFGCRVRFRLLVEPSFRAQFAELSDCADRPNSFFKPGENKRYDYYLLLFMENSLREMATFASRGQIELIRDVGYGMHNVPGSGYFETPHNLPYWMPSKDLLSEEFRQSARYIFGLNVFREDDCTMA